MGVTSLELPKPDFDKLFKAEENHFWFVYCNKVICNLLYPLIKERKSPRVLELGCGNGNVLRALQKRFPDATLVGSELHEDGLSYAKTRVNCELRQADIYNLPDWEPFDVAGIYDVLEHLPQDTRALSEIRNCIKPGGFLVITVPACMMLWSYFDEVAGHFRRYNSNALRSSLCEAGFLIKKIQYFMCPMFPAMWVSRTFNQLKKNLGFTWNKALREMASDELKISPLMNFIMGTLLSGEGILRKLGLSMPLGTSLFAIAENPDSGAINNLGA